MGKITDELKGRIEKLISKIDEKTFEAIADIVLTLETIDDRLTELENKITGGK